MMWEVKAMRTTRFGFHIMSFNHYLYNAYVTHPQQQQEQSNTLMAMDHTRPLCLFFPSHRAATTRATAAMALTTIDTPNPLAADSIVGTGCVGMVNLCVECVELACALLDVVLAEDDEVTAGDDWALDVMDADLADEVSGHQMSGEEVFLQLEEEDSG